MAGLTDKSISFGQQNFMFVESNETDLTYDYVSYMTRKGSILIARYPKSGASAGYYLGSGVYATIFAARATLTYGLPNTLEDQKL